MQIQETKKRTR